MFKPHSSNTGQRLLEKNIFFFKILIPLENCTIIYLFLFCHYNRTMYTLRVNIYLLSIYLYYLSIYLFIYVNYLNYASLHFLLKFKKSIKCY